MGWPDGVMVGDEWGGREKGDEQRKEMRMGERGREDAKVDFPVVDITGAQQLLKFDILNASRSPDTTSSCVHLNPINQPS